MGDWDFLHEMRDRGYSQDAIDDAMSSGTAPWEWGLSKNKKEKLSGNN